MKLKKNIEVNTFLETVRKCEGNVYFKTIEGDQLNLKSLLSQYILISIVNNDELMENGVIDCSNQSDLPILAPFME
ncbi:MAG: polya polymerase [Lachnospiraceae bacterium]|nr:polya polymerase [Lachnospiraceae bacterium]